MTENNHKFWSTQPVNKNSVMNNDLNNAPIEVKTINDVQKEPYNLPANFAWDSLDINDSNILDEVYELLNKNYVEDDDEVLRFDYSREFLKWALMPPNYKKEWHIGVRCQPSNKLVGFISGTPQKISVNKKHINMVEINYLCVHKKLRSKRLAPVLIKEITRRTNLHDIWQAVYTAGINLPGSVANNQYYHRGLNIKKLVDIKFMNIKSNMTLLSTIKLHKLDTKTNLDLRPLENKDIQKVHTLLDNYLNKFDLRPVFTIDEIAHWLMPRNNVINSYVNDEVTEFCSFYHLPSTVLGKNSRLNAVCSFYTVSSTSLESLMNDALILAKRLNCDVMNTLNMMDNMSVIKKLKYSEGTGNLKYYLYNWQCPEIKSDKVGLILL
jgi:glycylpeptide N-tetradecanoyltransferase